MKTVRIETFMDRLMSIGTALEVLPENEQYYLLGVADTLKRMQIVPNEERK